MTLSRRELLTGLGAVALCSACRDGVHQNRFPDTDAPSDMGVTSYGNGKAMVVEVRWREAVDPYGVVNTAAVKLMLAVAMERLVGSGTPWGEWAGANAKIGIKVNSVTSQAFTHPEVAGVVAEGLVQAGASPSGVTVWDRDYPTLVSRGYTLDLTGTSGYRCCGSNQTDLTTAKSISVAGHSVKLSPLVEGSDVLFNIAALKDHSMAGVTLSLKNNFGMLLSSEDLHGNFARGSGCEPGISDLAARPEIRDRLGLAMIDGLLGVCQGGPGPVDPAYLFRYAGLLISRDPVALDRRGLAIIEARRASLGLPPISERTLPNPSPPVHIENAAAKGVSPV